MKLEELMVGDIIFQHHPKDNTPHIVKVSVDTLDLMDKMKIGLIQEQSPLYRIIEPIPLTPEILEKNGFTDWADHSRTTRSCSMLVDKTNIIVQKIDGTDYIFTQIHRGGSDSCEFRMDLKYVHELQNVLRLCRIEKTIEL